MKDLIIIVGTVILGCILFDMIAGDEDSLKKAGADWMERQLQSSGQEER